MVGAMIRHLNSLRRMERDHGWIHTLLEGELTVKTQNDGVGLARKGSDEVLALGSTNSNKCVVRWSDQLVLQRLRMRGCT